jgi:Plavaka transposase
VRLQLVEDSPVEQEQLEYGATVAPVIISSDKTSLSQFAGDKSAWPVYLTLGNIAKSTRRLPSSHANILIGYLSASKLEVFQDKTRGAAGWRLLHYCMQKLLMPLVEAGKDGVNMTCADGRQCKIYPILAAYVADYEEQSLVTWTMKGCCPKCLAKPDKLGQHVWSVLQDQEKAKVVLESKGKGLDPDEFKSYGLRPIYKPFWAELPVRDLPVIFVILTSFGHSLK